MRDDNILLFSDPPAHCVQYRVWVNEKRAHKTQVRLVRTSGMAMKAFLLLS